MRSGRSSRTFDCGQLSRAFGWPRRGAYPTIWQDTVYSAIMRDRRVKGIIWHLVRDDGTSYIVGRGLGMTEQQLLIFEQYRGDEDAFSRTAPDSLRRLMRGFNWNDAIHHTQSLRMVKRGLTNSIFAAEVIAKARASCSSESAFSVLEQIAKTL